MERDEFVARLYAMEERLYRIAKSIVFNESDCGDVLGETVLKAWAKRHTLRDEALFERWLMRILVNECRNLRRVKPVLPIDDMEDFPDETPDYDVDLWAQLKKLPENYRLPLLLHYMDGYSLKDVAVILNLPLTSVKWRMVKGRERLKKELGEDFI